MTTIWPATVRRPSRTAKRGWRNTRNPSRESDAVEPGKTTIERILKDKPVSTPTPAAKDASCEEEESPERSVIANYPNHVWGRSAGFDNRFPFRRAVDIVDAQRVFSTLARLLVARSDRRPRLAPCHGIHDLPEAANFPGDSEVLGSHKRHPACRYPRFEPRPGWPNGSPCAAPRVPVRGKRGVRINLDVTFHAEQAHLPIIKLRCAA